MTDIDELGAVAIPAGKPIHVTVSITAVAIAPGSHAATIESRIAAEAGLPRLVHWIACFAQDASQQARILNDIRGCNLFQQFTSYRAKETENAG